VEEASEAEASEAVGAWGAEAADSAAREADTALAATAGLVVADLAAVPGALAEEPPADVGVLVALAEEPPANVGVKPDVVEGQQVVPDPLRTATSSAGFLACLQTMGYRIAIPLA
jgi:hypothetical protein